MSSKQFKLPLAVLICVGLVLSFFMGGSHALATTPPVSELANALDSIEQLDQLRSGLAGTLPGRTEPPTKQTMKEVCQPVGLQAQKLAQANGWDVRQIASRYRNPDHAPTLPEERAALKAFEQHPELMGFWETETFQGKAGSRYYRRINVESSCLACHGLKQQRPEFIQANYPNDLAYNFKVGDLRGMYAVFIPEVKQALQHPGTP